MCNWDLGPDALGAPGGTDCGDGLIWVWFGLNSHPDWLHRLVRSPAPSSPDWQGFPQRRSGGQVSGEARLLKVPHQEFILAPTDPLLHPLCNLLLWMVCSISACSGILSHTTLLLHLPAAASHIGSVGYHSRSNLGIHCTTGRYTVMVQTLSNALSDVQLGQCHTAAFFTILTPLHLDIESTSSNRYFSLYSPTSLSAPATSMHVDPHWRVLLMVCLLTRCPMCLTLYCPQKAKPVRTRQTWLCVIQSCPAWPNASRTGCTTFTFCDHPHLEGRRHTIDVSEALGCCRLCLVCPLFPVCLVSKGVGARLSTTLSVNLGKGLASFFLSFILKVPAWE